MASSKINWSYWSPNKGITMAFIGNQPFTAAFLTDTFSGNGSTVAFTMTVAPANTSSIIVAITGVLQDPSTYSVSGTTLTFSAAPPSGTSNISVRYLGIPASGVTTTAYRTVTNTTATASQTSFTIPSYTVGYVDVYRNGVYLPTSDYTATTGTTVVLNNAATVGDTITTISFYVSSVLNAIPATAGSVSTSYLVDGSVTQAKLSTNVAGNGPAFSAYKSSTAGNQSITTGVATIVTFDSTIFNQGSAYSTSTNRFTPQTAGYYMIIAGIGPQTSFTNAVDLYISKNGDVSTQGLTNTSGYIAARLYPLSSSTSNYLMALSGIAYMNGSTDYINIWVNGGLILAGTTTGSDRTYFMGYMIRAA